MPEKDRKPVVSFIFRKQDPAYFSLEKVFSTVIEALRSDIDVDIRTAGYPSSSIRNLLANIRSAGKSSAEVYHVTGDIHYTVLGLPSRKAVLTIHDCVFLERTSGMKRRLFKKLWLTWPVRRAAVVTTISEKSKNEIIAHTGVDPRKIVVIPNPIGEHIYYRERPFDREHPVILFIGSTPNKNLDRVIESLQGIPCILEIIGRISEVQQRRMDELGIAWRTLQQLSEEALADRYAGSDLVLFPSVYEGFGLPVTEAQKAGRSVITSDLSPMKEVAGNAACLVDPYSTDSIRSGVLKVIHDDQYRCELVKIGFENIRRYDRSTIAEQYLAVYRKLLNQ